MTNKMTKEFNISRKLRLTDPATVLVNKAKATKRVRNWIAENPLALWVATREQKVKLVRNAHSELKKAILKMHIDVYKENEKRKRLKEARMRVIKKLAKESVTVVGKHLAIPPTKRAY